MENIAVTFIIQIALASWHLLLDASVYILFGLLAAGLLKAFLNPAFVAAHLGQGRVVPVFKAALFGIPIPLCSCGVLPAAAALKKQGANNGATTAFLISTPESGVDSIAVSYGLLDPIMTVARPLAGFISAVAAGLAENVLSFRKKPDWPQGIDHCDQTGDCCDSVGSARADHKVRQPFTEKIGAGLRYAFLELWGDLAGWFFAGLLLAGVIAVLVPTGWMTFYLSGGLSSMLIMLAASIPMYICATASTPVAAVLIAKGVSPGAALVFLLAGPATNMASLSMLIGLLGRRATLLYLVILSFFAVISGLLVDQLYSGLHISAQATVGRAAGEFVPLWIQAVSALLIIGLSVRPIFLIIGRLFKWPRTGSGNRRVNSDSCGCSRGPNFPPLPKSRPLSPS